MKCQKICHGVICGALVSELVILSIASADNDEFVARLPSLHERLHTPHPDYRIPEYSNTTQVMDATGTISSHILFDYRSF